MHEVVDFLYKSPLIKKHSEKWINANEEYTFCPAKSSQWCIADFQMIIIQVNEVDETVEMI